jgi:hypothetical protein
MVGGKEHVDIMFLEDFGKPAVTKLPGSHLYGSAIFIYISQGIKVGKVEGPSERFTQRGYKFFIGIAFRTPKAKIAMGNRIIKARGFTEVNEHHTVYPAAAGYEQFPTFRPGEFPVYMGFKGF